ncbi:Flp pilus assembly protein CpaB [Methyloferula stellata]|uniref:Flp pilus assembly protein CpaB n=1 Tax=Methyloferula stellata TaxID=876270 RepID=UPI00047DFA3F|nr:Flp pilus assembly protein CpaB [Methyloferula stellata]
MKVARLAVLGVALVAGLAAAYLASSSKPPEAPAPVPAAPTVATDDVLVAARELTFGSVLTPADMRWQSWPKANVPEGVIRKSSSPDAMNEVNGSVVRSNFSEGEPFRRERLVKGANSNFMAAILTPGMRAVSINIEASGSNTAGGFILPNDHVDVLHTIHDDATAKAGGDGYVTEPILTNIRVLAIGQTVQEKNNERVVSGTSATLEVTPRQASILILAQRIGQLSLILRSMADSNTNESETTERPEQPVKTIVKYGVALQVQSH